MKIIIYYLIFLIVSIGFLGCQNSQQETVVVYLVRHAEKDLSDTTSNPPLTMKGEQRANKLVEELKTVDIDAIYSTSYDRNMNTVQPLANFLGLSIQSYERDNWKPLMESIVQRKGEAILICGHGENLLPMIEALGGKRPLEFLEKHEYDNIFKVVISEGEVEVTTKKY